MTHTEFTQARDNAMKHAIRGDLNQIALTHGVKLAAVHDSLFGRNSKNVTENNTKYLKTLLEIASKRRTETRSILDAAAALSI